LCRVLSVPYYLAATAETCYELGRLDEALELVTEAIDSAERTGERWYEAESQRLAASYRCFVIPLRIRSGKNLSNRDRSRAKAGSEIVGTASDNKPRGCSQSRAIQTRRARCSPNSTTGFTEGFDTPDLQDAKALLAGLCE
jgi:predicted ATPase